MIRTLWALAVLVTLCGVWIGASQSSTQQHSSDRLQMNWRIQSNVSAILYKSPNVPGAARVSIRAQQPDISIQVLGCAGGGGESVKLRAESSMVVNGCQIEILQGTAATGVWEFLGDGSTGR